MTVLSDLMKGIYTQSYNMISLSFNSGNRASEIMIQTYKKIDDMDYDELEGLKEEEEQEIDNMEDSLVEHKQVLDYIIKKIDEMDAQED